MQIFKVLHHLDKIFQTLQIFSRLILQLFPIFIMAKDESFIVLSGHSYLNLMPGAAAAILCKAKCHSGWEISHRD